MSSQLVSVTFNTQNLEPMRDFYNALGANLQASKVNRGGDVLRGLLGNLEVVLHNIKLPGETPTPRVSLRFELQNIDGIWKTVKTLSDVNVMMDLESLPTGKTFIVIDPDGHSIEIFEKWAEGHDSGG